MANCMLFAWSVDATRRIHGKPSIPIISKTAILEDLLLLTIKEFIGFHYNHLRYLFYSFSQDTLKDIKYILRHSYGEIS